MPESPESGRHIAQMQKDIEELKEYVRDDWHDQREKFEKRVRRIMEKSSDCVKLWLELDGIRSVNEIEEDLSSKGEEIAHTTMWRCCKKLVDAGLIKKVGTKGKSPVYSKKMWAKELNIDDFVRQNFLE